VNRSIRKCLIAVLLLALVAACAEPEPTGTVTPAPTREPIATSTRQAVPTPSPTALSMTHTPAIPAAVRVDTVSLMPSKDPGGSWLVRLEGSLPDSCTQIEAIVQHNEGERILLEIVADQVAGESCTEGPVAFVRQVPVDTAGLPPGEYVVEADGREAILVIQPQDAPTSPTRAAEAVLVRLAMVDDVELVISDSGAARFSLVVSGYYNDGCTRWGGFTQQVDGRRITVSVYTRRPRDAMCTQAIVPFSETIPLDLAGLEPGTYTVDVNGHTLEVTLP